ncbi:MAG TPA: hypothetical protein VII95_12130 [Terriglobales bacterium]
MHRAHSVCDPNGLPRLDAAKRGKSGWDDGHQILDLIGSRTEHKQGDLAIRKILLMLHALVNCYKDIESLLSQQQKRTILCSRPSHLLHGSAFMFGEQPL